MTTHRTQVDRNFGHCVRAQFYGVYRTAEGDANCVFYMVDRGSGLIIRKYIEDEDDGYRSMMNDGGEVAVTDSLVRRFNLVDNPISIMIDEAPRDFDGVVFYSLNGRMIGRIGTDNYDDYYPCAIDELDIEAINEEYFS